MPFQQGHFYGLNDSGQISRNFIIPEPKHQPLLFAEPRITGQITCRPMMTAINFDSDLERQASKVQNVWTDGMLSPKPDAQALVPERLPEESLFKRHLFPEASGLCVFACVVTHGASLDRILRSESAFYPLFALLTSPLDKGDKALQMSPSHEGDARNAGRG